jgi:hypothetical protein
MLRLLLRLLGVAVVGMTREEAALWLMEREVRFVYRPVVVEVRR